MLFRSAKSTSSAATAKTTTSEADKDVLKGDVNCDGDITLADAVLVMQSIANPAKFGEKGSDTNHITVQGSKNADVIGKDGITNKDALEIQKFTLHLIKAFE